LFGQYPVVHQVISKVYSGVPQSQYKTCTCTVPLGTGHINPYFLDAGLPGCFDGWAGLNNNAVGNSNFAVVIFCNLTRLDGKGKGRSVFIFEQ